MKKIAIIPAYNEQDSIVKTVTDLQKKAPDFDYIIINDCSIDNKMDIFVEHWFNVVNLNIKVGILGEVNSVYRGSV